MNLALILFFSLLTAYSTVKADSPSLASGSDQVPVVVLDPGHGGGDRGAVGDGDLFEKDITMDVANDLRVLLGEGGIEVYLTRSSDKYVSLKDRTYLANSMEADLFISLHVNASAGKKKSGFEVFYLDNTNDKATKALVERENNAGDESPTQRDLDFMLGDLLQSGKISVSVNLARTIEEEMRTYLSPLSADVRSNGVNKAPFFVLVGAHMPCVLIEMFFIDQVKDRELLRDHSFRSEIARGISRGVIKYIQNLKKT